MVAWRGGVVMIAVAIVAMFAFVYIGAALCYGQCQDPWRREYEPPMTSVEYVRCMSDGTDTNRSDAQIDAWINQFPHVVTKLYSYQERNTNSCAFVTFAAISAIVFVLMRAITIHSHEQED